MESGRNKQRDSLPPHTVKGKEKKPLSVHEEIFRDAMYNHFVWDEEELQVLRDKFRTFISLYGYIQEDDAHAFSSFSAFYYVCSKIGQEFGENHLNAWCERAFKAFILFGEVKEFNLFIKAHGNQFKNPVHDILVLAQLPDNKNNSFHWPAWKKIIKQSGIQALKYFALAPAIEKKIIERDPTQTGKPSHLEQIKEMAALLRYARSHEYPALASICMASYIPEAVFNRCLLVEKNRKRSDLLPRAVIAGDQVGFPGYYLVNLPIDDPYAYILGNLTHNCQHIGSAGEICIIDGLTRQRNGFYVLLKANKKNISEKELYLENGQINYKKFSIIGQGYAWLTTLGNLTLDSWENIREKDNIIVIALLKAFAEQVTQEHTDILRVTIGKSGKTPSQIGPLIDNPETMYEGTFYGDASSQLLIYCHTERQHGFIMELQQVVMGIIEAEDKKFNDALISEHNVYSYQHYLELKTLLQMSEVQTLLKEQYRENGLPEFELNTLSALRHLPGQKKWSLIENLGHQFFQDKLIKLDQVMQMSTAFEPDELMRFFKVIIGRENCLAMIPDCLTLAQMMRALPLPFRLHFLMDIMGKEFIKEKIQHAQQVSQILMLLPSKDKMTFLVERIGRETLCQMIQGNGNDLITIVGAFKEKRRCPLLLEFFGIAYLQHAIKSSKNLEELLQLLETDHQFELLSHLGKKNLPPFKSLSSLLSLMRVFAMDKRYDFLSQFLTPKQLAELISTPTDLEQLLSNLAMKDQITCLEQLIGRKKIQQIVTHVESVCTILACLSPHERRRFLMTTLGIKWVLTLIENLSALSAITKCLPEEERAPFLFSILKIKPFYEDMKDIQSVTTLLELLPTQEQPFFIETVLATHLEKLLEDKNEREALIKLESLLEAMARENGLFLLNTLSTTWLHSHLRGTLQVNYLLRHLPQADKMSFLNKLGIHWLKGKIEAGGDEQSRRNFLELEISKNQQRKLRALMNAENEAEKDLKAKQDRILHPPTPWIVRGFFAPTILLKTGESVRVPENVKLQWDEIAAANNKEKSFIAAKEEIEKKGKQAASQSSFFRHSTTQDYFDSFLQQEETLSNKEKAKHSGE